MTVTTVARAEPAAPSRFANHPEATARAAWEYPVGHRRTGTVGVPLRTPLGATVTIWVEDTGAETTPPPSGDEAASTAVAAGFGSFALLALSAGGIVHVRLRRVEARSLGQWGREWERLEPHWSGRLRKEHGVDGD
ncbi:hypothetical protein OG490_03605 [Streptomyces sp. NBC_00503]|nr:hypothetical protein [Streptomyces sp. NBC_00503]WUD79736.1 hypothetical protein OG490_03605 [Streptomyces sp. NBC_00503]